ncbi:MULTISPECIES: helix-turn-helix domain-containing protein [Legionella]|uniref:Transposase (ISmav2) n=1 Tax=Legionella drozanskii LLAP-1 TaxID=1212489 RepID=A0A0W0SN40_9GAMM|nr:MULTISPECIES: helix-turn-helix domain-containing protein [Legionella]KTC84747.1 transposase (ISmav2) [Legionella drozanskii LLAP-1]PJE18492.1 MAG: hypothetical protein CK430_00090 [Legionella sp.]
MLWKETVPIKEKIKFVSNYLEKNFDIFVELCSFYGISRKTGYKYVKQFEESGNLNFRVIQLFEFVGPLDITPQESSLKKIKINGRPIEK